jgi:hypothetical protein
VQDGYVSPASAAADYGLSPDALALAATVADEQERQTYG